MRLSLPMKRAAVEELDASALIPIRVQDETNSLVFRVAGFVARSLQIAADMRLARASPAARNPARLSLILNANWNKGQRHLTDKSRQESDQKKRAVALQKELLSKLPPGHPLRKTTEERDRE